MADPLLRIEDLTAGYATRRGWVRAVDGVSLEVARGETLGLVGESGSGKTTLALALLRVLPENARTTGGRVLLEGSDLLALPEEAMRRVRWRSIAMVFQAAMSSLSPVHRVGDQVAEVIMLHEGASPAEAWARVRDLFALAGLDPALAERHPHELSGGMRQRAVIALALACQPALLIADEPTSALDVLVQDRLLEELRGIQRTRGMAMLFISHDLGVVASMSQRIAIMYAGKIVETASTSDVLARPRHPYTHALAAAAPRLHGPKGALTALPGDPPDPVAPVAGCAFAPRCPRAIDVCRRQTPMLQEHAPGRCAACWNPVPDGEAAR